MVAKKSDVNQPSARKASRRPVCASQKPAQPQPEQLQQTPPVPLPVLPKQALRDAWEQQVAAMDWGESTLLIRLAIAYSPDGEHEDTDDGVLLEDTEAVTDDSDALCLTAMV